MSKFNRYWSSLDADILFGQYWKTAKRIAQAAYHLRTDEITKLKEENSRWKAQLELWENDSSEHLIKLKGRVKELGNEYNNFVMQTIKNEKYLVQRAEASEERVKELEQALLHEATVKGRVVELEAKAKQLAEGVLVSCDCRAFSNPLCGYCAMAKEVLGNE